MSLAALERMDHKAPTLIRLPMRNEPLPLESLAWPAEQLADGLAELGRRAGLSPADIDPSLLPGKVDTQDALELDRYVRWLASASGLMAEAVEAPAASVDAMLRGSLPAVLRLWRDGEAVFVFLLRAKGDRLTVIGPDGALHSCATSMLRDALLAGHEAPLRHEIGKALSLLRLAPAAHEASLSAIARARLGAKPIGGLWSLALAEQAPLTRRIIAGGLHWLMLGLLGAFALSYLIEITGWRLMGGAILGGRTDSGWLAAWALLLVSAIPVRTLGARINARLTVRASALIKQRLLAGALALDTGQLRHKGAGQILAQAMESQAFESVAVNGGMAAVIAVIEVVIAGVILAAAPSASLLLPLLVIWLAAIGGLGFRYFRRLAQWSETRLGLTHEMVERMIGHRTVLAQEPPQRREALTDISLKQYHQSSRRLDDAVMPFLASLPSGWSVAALAALAPGFIAGAVTPEGLAVAIGGILFAGRAINTICGGIAGIARAAVAWKQAEPLFAAAGRRKRPGRFIPGRAVAGLGGAATPVIEAEGLSYSHSSAGQMILEDASLTIRPGERMLLEGRSGGGKSTLASLLTGLRTPQSGLLLLNGLDRHTLGEAWHRIATEAPQFHENHIFSAPLAYNLLMGKRWPATAEDLAEAREVCTELGLAPLIERMPAGLMQMVGETGWQMSHGEKSRVYLARALLQGAALTILDESFAALDPETLKLCVACATKRAATLVVIAHP